MGFDSAIKLGFSNYVNFSGRACRSEFWYWFLFYAVGMLASGVIDRWPPLILDGIFFLATFLPGLSVSVRRLHDLDRSGRGAGRERVVLRDVGDLPHACRGPRCSQLRWEKRADRFMIRNMTRRATGERGILRV